MTDSRRRVNKMFGLSEDCLWENKEASQVTSSYVDRLLLPTKCSFVAREKPPPVPPAPNVDKTKIRKYPCGYPGCQWVFTRTNHVVRHHERVHPGFKPNKSNNTNDAEKVAAAAVAAAAMAGTSSATNQSSRTAVASAAAAVKVAAATAKASTSGAASLTLASRTAGGGEIETVPNESRKMGLLPFLTCNQDNYKQVLTDAILLKNHMKLFHGPNDDVVPSLDQSLHLRTSNGFKLREALTGYHLCYFNGCKQRFNTKNELNIHLFHVHSLVEPEVCIKVEGQEWVDEENNTTLTNKLDRRYTCDFVGCDKSYTKNSHLIRHKEDTHNILRPSQPIKILRSPRPYACTLPGCDKTYTKNSHLVRHLVETHKMAKPAPKANRRLSPNFSPLTTGLLTISSSSSSSTVSSSSLLSTEDNSTIYNDRPYACNFPGCGWSFKRQYHLNRHIITHKMNNRSRDNNRGHNGSNNGANGGLNNGNNNGNRDDRSRNHIFSSNNNGKQRSESISWIVLEDGDDDDDHDSSNQDPLDLISHRHISIREETLSCDYPGCGQIFVSSSELMQHYLQHSGPSGLLSVSDNHDLNDMLEEPPLECVLEEFDDEDENDEDDENKDDNEDDEPILSISRKSISSKMKGN